MPTVFLPSPIKRRLADGRIVTYDPKKYQCRFWVHGRQVLSTGTSNKAEAQRLADIWFAQAKAGKPYDPPPSRRGKPPMLEKAELIGVTESVQSLPILRYIRMRRQLGTAAETILSEVEQLLSSGLGRQASDAPLVNRVYAAK